MKLIIDIDKRVYERALKNKGTDTSLDDMDRLGLEVAVEEGIPLENIKTEIEDQRSLWDSTPKNGHYRAFSTCIDILDEYIKGNRK